MRKKGFPYTILFFVLLLLTNSSNISAEGSKELLPNAGDELALYCNNNLYYNFARYDGTDEQRLYIHIADPENEQVFLGFSQPHTDGHNPTTTLTLSYFRIKDPSGNVVYVAELINGATANISTRTQAVNGPNEIIGTGGYDAFTFDPSGQGLAAGDYYIEFNLDAVTYNSSNLLFRYFDITVADNSGTPAAINGRVYSKNWALFAPSIANPDITYGYMDRAFNGSVHVLTAEGFVSKIDFNGSNFQPAAFNISFNSSGTSNTGNILADRKSVEDNQSNSPELKIFLNDPDPIEYPSGTYGEYLTGSEYPAIIGCAATGCYIRVAITAPGIVEVLLDQNTVSGAGKYDAGTEDRILAYNVTPGTGEPTPYIRDIPWDGLDGLGGTVDVVNPIATEIAFSQGAYHIPVYDVEYNLNGFSASIVRPTPPVGYTLKFYYDDTDISENGTSPAETEGCVPSCHSWNVKLYGDVNTINTYWYAKQEIAYSNLTVVEPGCGCAMSGSNVIGTVFNDLDGSGAMDGAEDGSSLDNIDVLLYEDLNQNGLVDGGDTYITTDITDANGEFSFALNHSIPNNISVNTGNDDAEEDADENVDLIDNTLSMEVDNFVGLRFQSINVPVGSSISGAYIEFYSTSTNTVSADFDISGEAIDDAPAFSGLITDRTYSSIVNWDNVETWTTASTYQTPDIKSIVQSIVNRPGWASGNSMVFMIAKDDADGGSGARHAASFNAGSTAPKLVITYDNLPKYYVLATDQTDFPSGMSLTTDNVEASPFAITEQSDCSNDFGLTPPLPVELINFQARAEGCNVIVEWTAAIEEGFSHYELERRTGQNRFSTTAVVPSKVGESTPYYSYIDDKAESSNYYRLKMVDLDGSFEYSDIVAVDLNCRKSHPLEVFPNPIQSGATLKVKMYTEKQSARLTITNVLGKVLRVLNLSTEKGWNMAQIDVSDLPNGTYFIMDREAVESFPVKFIKGNL